jgi:hypothetical protein
MRLTCRGQARAWRARDSGSSWPDSSVECTRGSSRGPAAANQASHARQGAERYHRARTGQQQPPCHSPSSEPVASTRVVITPT